MADYTNKIGFVKQAVGENSMVWGAVQNASFIDLCDEVIAGRSNVDCTDVNIDLEFTEGVSAPWRHMILRFTGSPALPPTVIVPQKQKFYVLDNQCGETVTIKTASGIGIEVAHEEVVLAMMDESTGRAFKLVLHGQNALAQAASPMSVVPSTIHVAGNAVNVYTMTEGSLRTFYLLGIGPIEFPAAAGFEINPNSGVFPAPTRQQSVPVFVKSGESASPDDIFEAYAQITATRINIFFAEPLMFFAASRALHAVTFTVSNAPNP